MINLAQLFDRKKGNDTVKPKRPVDKVKKFIDYEFEHRLDHLTEVFISGNRKDIQVAYKKAMESFTARNAFKETLEKMVIKEKMPLYLTEYRFLKEAFHFLTKSKEEAFCLVTGPECDGNLFTLTRMLEPKMKRQSIGGAEPDFGSLNQMLVEMDEIEGNHLISYFHSHPGKGAGSTQPSGIDRRTQEKFERGGYPVVGAIFSRDGYVRFFSHDRKFQVKASGKGGEQIDEKLFKLSEDKVKKVSLSNTHP